MPWVVEPYLAFDPGLQLHPQITISANITQSGYMVCILATGTVNLDYSRAASDVLDEHLEGENVEVCPGDAGQGEVCGARRACDRVTVLSPGPLLLFALRPALTDGPGFG